MDIPAGQRQSTNIKCFIYCNAFKMQCEIPHSPELKKQGLFLFARTFSSFGIINKTVKKNIRTQAISQGPTGPDPILLLYENLKSASIFLKGSALQVTSVERPLDTL